MLCSTIRKILVEAEQTFGALDAIRYKKGKKEIQLEQYQNIDELKINHKQQEISDDDDDDDDEEERENVLPFLYPSQFNK